jgi:hypothetical protein
LGEGESEESGKSDEVVHAQTPVLDIQQGENRGVLGFELEIIEFCQNSAILACRNRGITAIDHAFGAVVGS